MTLATFLPLLSVSSGANGRHQICLSVKAQTDTSARPIFVPPGGLSVACEGLAGDPVAAQFAANHGYHQLTERATETINPNPVEASDALRPDWLSHSTISLTRMDVLLRQADLAKAARACAGAAFAVLTNLSVVPTSRYHPFIRVGRDYEGMPVMALSEFKALEAMLNSAYPNRFSDPLRRDRPEFANHYILSFIEASVRRCADSDFKVDDVGVTESVAELFALLDAPAHMIASVRAVSHVATQDGYDLT